MKIPEDLSVMSFDDDQLASYMSPGLTTMRLPYEEMGRIGAELALSPRGDGDCGRENLVPMSLIERESVARLS